MKRIFLFDLDGTITEPKEGITKCVQYSLEYLGIHESDLDKLECFIGPPLHKSYQVYYNLSEEEAFKAVDKYRERYKDIGIFECNLYEGIEEVFKAIKAKGGIIGLATSKPEEFAVRLLEHYNLSQYFDCITGSLMDGRRTEKAEVIEEAFARMGINNEKKPETIMIGDRLHDILGANKTGIESIGVKYGYSVGNELVEAGATYVVETTKELKALAEKLIEN
mgnify:FL=1